MNTYFYVLLSPNRADELISDPHEDMRQYKRLNQLSRLQLKLYMYRKMRNGTEMEWEKLSSADKLSRNMR